MIVGTPSNHFIYAGVDGDTVCALGGDDIVIGGIGRDTVFGNEGDDLLQGGIGPHTRGR